MEDLLSIDDLKQKLKKKPDDAFSRLNLALKHLKSGNTKDAFVEFANTKTITKPNSKEHKIAHEFAHEIAHQLKEPDLEGMGVKEFLELIEQFRINPSNQQLKYNIIKLSKQLNPKDVALQENNYLLINNGIFKGTENQFHNKHIIVTNSPKFTSNYALEKTSSVIICGGNFPGNSALFELKKVTILDGEFSGEFSLTSAENLIIAGGNFSRMGLFKTNNTIITGGTFKDRGTLLESNKNTIIAGSFPGRYKFSKMSNSIIFLHNGVIEDIKNPGENNLFIINQIKRIKFEDDKTLNSNSFYSTNEPKIESKDKSFVRWHKVDQKAFDDVIQEVKEVTLKTLDRATKIIESAALEKEEYAEL